MKILGIETSCDETSISIVEARGEVSSPSFKVHSHLTLSQIALHQEYGGVFPNLAKREHSKNITALFIEVLKKSNYSTEPVTAFSESTAATLATILEREPDLFSEFLTKIPQEKPDIDAIAVTTGPGLEPALWVGINFARALSCVWNIPIIPTNHMEGHIASVFFDTPSLEGRDFSSTTIATPALALLISGGHTEIVHIEKWGSYKIIGQTLDDAAGEAFDKVGRLLSLPYPAGPEISRLANISRQQYEVSELSLPRPMIKDSSLNFSFSGLKTAVLYSLKKLPEHTDDVIQKMCREFEDAVVDVLVEKSTRALSEASFPSFIIAGGVSANTHIRKSLKALVDTEFSETSLLFPHSTLTGDNAAMIAGAGYLSYLHTPENVLPYSSPKLKASGSMRLGQG